MYRSSIMLRRLLRPVKSFQVMKSQESQFLRYTEYFASRCFSCWRCGRQENNTVQCQVCHATFDLTKINYFELFGLPLNYDVNATKVVSSYHNLQKQFHPDKHSNDAEHIQEISEKFSIFVNRAYKTLISPIDRGIYILSLHDVPFEITTTNNQELLADILEIDHNLLQATEESIVKIQNTLITTLNQLNSELSEAFKGEDYARAQETLVKMKYFDNLIRKSKTRF